MFSSCFWKISLSPLVLWEMSERPSCLFSAVNCLRPPSHYHMSCRLLGNLTKPHLSVVGGRGSGNMSYSHTLHKWPPSRLLAVNVWQGLCQRAAPAKDLLPGCGTACRETYVPLPTNTGSQKKSSKF